MHELPEDLTNSLRSFRGSIYGRGQPQEGQSARVEDGDLEKGPEDYGDTEFDRALNTSQSSFDMVRQVLAVPTVTTLLTPMPQQSAMSGQDMNHVQPEQQDEKVDIEKPDQVLRFDDEEDDVGHGVERPRVDTSTEKGKRSTHQTPSTPGKRSVLQGVHVKDLDPAAARLAEDETPLSQADFYELMGLNPPPPPTDVSTSKLPNETIEDLMKPGGLYTKIFKLTRYTNRKYHAFAIAVYVFLVLQLIISAVFIILGSLRNVDTHITIAVLGAVSTVIAGGLALMQGQGLPNRLRQTRDALNNVVFAAQELWWDEKTGRPILYKDVKKIREDYLRVLEDQKNNNPDTWKAAGTIEQGVARTVRGKA